MLFQSNPSKKKVKVEALMKETLSVSCYSRRSVFPKQSIPVAKCFLLFLQNCSITDVLQVSKYVGGIYNKPLTTLFDQYRNMMMLFDLLPLRITLHCAKLFYTLK